jgi:hypothetical protein
MKNLLIYVNPEKKMSKEHDDLTKIQIDNSLSLGWKPKDIILVTNFDYDYKGVSTIKVNDYSVFDQNRSTKIPAIIQLFNDGVIGEDIYWFHDHDAFQLVPFEVKLKTDAGFTDHGFSPLWNAGSFFFKKGAIDIFTTIYSLMNSRNTNEQDALTYMWKHNIARVNNRYEKINITYNIGIYHIDDNLKKSDLPVKVAHFHPHKARHLNLFRKMLPERLITIFKKYGITWHINV